MDDTTNKMAARLERREFQEKMQSIWTGRYKLGPIQREFHYYAKNEGDARLKAKIYVDFLNRQENYRHILVGQPRPFVIDIPSLVAEEERKNALQEPSSAA